MSGESSVKTSDSGIGQYGNIDDANANQVVVGDLLALRQSTLTNLIRRHKKYTYLVSTAVFDDREEGCG